MVYVLLRVGGLGGTLDGLMLELVDVLHLLARELVPGMGEVEVYSFEFFHMSRYLIKVKQRMHRIPRIVRVVVQYRLRLLLQAVFGNRIAHEFLII